MCSCFVERADTRADWDALSDWASSFLGEQNPKRKKMMDEAEYASDGDSEGAHFGAGGQVTAKQKRMDTKELEEETELRCSDLIVLGLPFKLTEDELREHFEQYGKVKDASECLCN